MHCGYEPGRHAMVSTQIERASDTGPARFAAGPVGPSSRIVGIDVLRGLALFGVLAINIVFEFRVSIFEQFLPPAGTPHTIDRVLRDFLAAAIALKALALFSFLFGVGMAIQFDRLASDPRRTDLLIQRLMVLLGIGAAHLFLLWNGDILVEYALAGLVVLPFLFGPTWLILIVAAASLVLFLMMPLLPPVVPFPSQSLMRELVAEAASAYGNGGFLDVLAFRMREMPAILPLHVLIFPRTVALFLFGVLAWRSGILRRASGHRKLLFSIALFGVLFGSALTLAAQGRDFFGWPSLGRAHDLVERLGGIVLAAGYGAGILAFVTVPTGQRMLAWAAPVGRMAFTNYLGQSMILGCIFYGYGLGLFGKLSVSTAFTIGVVVYAMQAVFSAWWLNRYRYGPVEWLWRSLMYGSRQPMVHS
jgi:uncharacterized protein